MVTESPLRKCLIANRGEIAVRVIRACEELGIETVAVYSDADARARHAQLATKAVSVGAADPHDSYLNIGKLIAAARATGCDCVHPGYGFLAEAPAFAQAVLDAGLTWVGPGVEAIRLMGVKTEARALMRQAGVPLVPGFPAAEADDAAFAAAADEIGYPVMVKAAGGGGGKGIRVVHDAHDLVDALNAARREAAHAFGDASVFLEKFIDSARHIEVQVLADAHGHVVHLFERECSAQRRHQKIVEEAPSPLLDDDGRAAMGEAAVGAARAVGYVNAGTVEFIATPDGQFYFLEMNTRLQVEHPVTEWVTGVDIVKLQFDIAAGRPLPFTQSEITRRGHAIECRLYAEDPRNNFLPATGPLLSFVPPDGPGIRVDSGVQPGDEVTIHYDPLIAKIIVHAPTRADACARMRAALARTVVLGTTTNIAFLRALLDHPAFLAGGVDTGFIDAHLPELLPDEPPVPDAALIAAALMELHGAGQAVEANRPFTSSDAEGDRYSPWARADDFRMGGS